MNSNDLAYFRQYRKRPQWKRYHVAYMRQWRDDRRSLALAAQSVGASPFSVRPSSDEANASEASENRLSA